MILVYMKNILPVNTGIIIVYSFGVLKQVVGTAIIISRCSASSLAGAFWDGTFHIKESSAWGLGFGV